MTDRTSVLIALHGSLVLLSGLVGGLFFARAIRQASGEVPWRVVHAGGCAAGVMLLAIAVPIQWASLPPLLEMALVWCLVLGTYLLVGGMFVAAIWRQRGIPGGGSGLNKLVSSAYGAGAVLTLIGSLLLVIGLLNTARSR